MNTPIAVHTERGYRVEVMVDEDPLDPRKEYDNLGTLVTWHQRRELLGDKHVRIPQSATERDALIPEHAIWLPVYCYDHGGIVLNTVGYHCPWDSGQVGVIYCTIESAQKEFPDLRGAGLSVKVEELLRLEIETYSSYLEGAVFGYVIRDPEGNELDSCWNFGEPDYAMTEGRQALVHVLEQHAIAPGL